MPEAVVSKSHALDQLCVNTVRVLAIDAVQQANSGHPGAPMGLAPLCYVLWMKHLRHNPENPGWYGRDRFVLSAGHASMLLYSLLHLTGYGLTLEDLKQFRLWGSLTPGHPEYAHPPGTETTTGPLGQGVGNSVGMAIAQAHLAAEFGRPGHDVFDHRTYFVASDGDMMEGISHEACSLAGHLRLGYLIGFYDDNGITIDGETSLTLSDDAAKRFEAYGWHVQRVDDGNDLAAIDAAIGMAKTTDRPSLIIVKTHIGYGSPNKQDSSAAHGSPLGEEEVQLTKQNLGWDYPESFTVPDEALAVWRSAHRRGQGIEADWQRDFDAYAMEFPDLAREYERRMRAELPQAWERALPDLSLEGATATRAASGKVLNAVAGALPELIGGSADLAPSNNTRIDGAESLGPGSLAGRNMHFGVREHGMGAVLNGMALHGGVLPYGGTFLVFSDYVRPSIRLAAMMGLHVVYVFTHDSIGLGEDGPTHQPVEMLSALRAIPNLLVIRPADAAETVEAWRVAIEHRGGPVALSLTRQKVPPLNRAQPTQVSELAKGGYVLSEAEGDGLLAILLASGSEVQIAVEAQGKLAAMGVPARVVSMPCLEFFARQPSVYREQVLPPEVRVRVAVEAAQPMSWYRWVGSEGDVVALERFGASASSERLYREFEITADAVVERVQHLVNG